MPNYRASLFLGIVGIVISLAVYVWQDRTSSRLADGVAVEKLEIAAKNALAYVSHAQEEDGSWPSLMSNTPDFTQAVPAARVFPTMFILRTLKKARFEAEPFYARGVRYLRDAKELEVSLWAVDGRHHDLMHRFGSFPCKIVPDTDSSSWGLLLLADELSLSTVDTKAIAGRFRAVMDERGLYGTYLFGHYGEGECPADYGNSSSLGANFTILALFRRLGLESEAEALEVALWAALRAPGYLSSAVYYRSRALLAYLAGLGEARLMAAFLIEDLEKSEAFLDLSRWNTIDLAAYLYAKTDICIASGESCGGLEPVASALLGRQRVDGGWDAAPLYVAGAREDMPRSTEFFFGSSVETTALALRALDEFASFRGRAN
jgi:hypothetical protein